MPSLVASIGQALRPYRAGLRAVASARFSAPPLSLSSPAFADGQPMPGRFTADGDGLFPPLAWSGLPAATRSLALLVEDVDVPFSRSLAHLVLHGLPADAENLAEGAVPLRQRMHDPRFEVGYNSLYRQGWLPPSPIPGHGPHRYVFQLFALRAAPGFSRIPSRPALLRAIAPLLLAQGRPSAPTSEVSRYSAPPLAPSRKGEERRWPRPSDKSSDAPTNRLLKPCLDIS